MQIKIISTGEVIALGAFHALHPNKTFGGLPSEQQLAAEGASYYVPPVDLEALREGKRAEINAARLAANFSTFTHAGKVIACDQLSRGDIDGTNGFVALFGVLPPGWPGGWKAVDNTYIAITSVAEWKAFYASMFAAGSANFANSQVKKQQIASATTQAEIEQVAW